MKAVSLDEDKTIITVSLPAAALAYLRLAAGSPGVFTGDIPDV
jgi:hypothetical protein